MIIHLMNQLNITFEKISFINIDIIIGFVFSLIITVLGYIGYLRNKQSITNKFFLIYCILISTWGLANIFVFRVMSESIFLWLVRTILFIAVWINFIIYWLTKVYPLDTFLFNKKEFYLSFLASAIISLVVLSSLTVKGIKVFAEFERDVIMGPGIIFFGMLAAFFNLGGVYNLIFKLISFKKNRNVYLLLLAGLFITSFLVIFFNFIMPNVFHVTKFVPYGSLFMFPFVISIFIGIYRYQLFNIRLASAVIFIIVLLTLNLYEIAQITDLYKIIEKFIVLFLLFIFSLFLVQSVYREIEQREELEKLNKELDRLNRLKSEFLSIVSHQIRSPMINIRGFVELLVHGTYGELPQEAINTLKKIEKNIQAEIDLVNNLLDLRKIEEGRMEYEFSHFNLTEVVRDSCEFYKIKAQEKNLELKYNLVQDIFIKADKEKIVQVVNNLIDNAIKYTDQGYIEVDLKEFDDKVLITIKDTGRGIKKENLEKIFEAFSRGEEVKKEILGTGLGLYIAKNIIDAHQGKIWAESEGLGKGSTFYIELPKGL